MELTIEQALLQAIEAHMSGRFQDAERLYRAILQAQPNHPDANHNLGVLAVEVNKPEAALPFLKNALDANPNQGQFWVSYIDALIKSNQLEMARQVLRQGRKIGLNGDAVEILDQQLGQSKAAAGCVTEGTGRARSSALSDNLAPTQDEIDAMVSHFDNGQYEVLRELALDMTKNFPSHPFGWKAMGTVLVRMGNLSESLAFLRKAVELSPGDAEAHNNLGKALRDLGRPDEAEICCRQAITSNPDLSAAHDNLGHALQDLGRLEEAEASYRQAITLRPEKAEYLRHLSRLKKFVKGDSDIAPIEKAYHDAAVSEEDRIQICFAMGKVCEDIGNHDEAFSAYAKGNRLRKRQLAYSIDEDRAIFRRIKSSFEALPEVERIPFGRANPILIVGMPRSGTTVIEQILASHSAVYGAGELHLLGNMGLTNFHNDRSFDLAAESRRIASAYFEALDGLSEGKDYVTDKMPQNFRLLGFLLLANPDIRVVHTLRDPIATCWSIFREYFPAEGLRFAWDLDDIAEYYKLYRDLMAFWREKFPGRIYDLNYEYLTEHQEVETRHLLEYCGLKWEDSCLNFHETNRAVRTASSLQVRQKLYRGSSEAWRNHEKHLQYLIKTLAC